MPDETFPLRFQLTAQVGEIVDFPVENDDVTPIGADHRLMAGRREIDDGEADEAKTDRILAPDAGIVGTAVSKGCDRPLQIKLAAALFRL